MGDFKQRRLAAAPRVLHPSEDLSELPPLRSVVAGQEYHCPRTRSLRGSLPKLLPAGWGRSSPYWAVFMQEHRSRTGGLRASSASLFHFWLIRLMSFSRWICTFQAAREHVLKIPLTPYPYSSPCCTKLFSRFQKFQQFRQNSILFVVQCHERNAEFFGCFPFAAVFEEKHINELTIIL